MQITVHDVLVFMTGFLSSCLIWVVVKIVS
jgi:hypothetical protein